MIVVLSLVNFIENRTDASLGRFVLLMLIAMLVCFIADLLMAGVFYITPVSLINGVIFFTLGHVFYLLALRNRSSLLLRSNVPKLITRNLAIWFVTVLLVFFLFFLTLFDPTDMVISIGLLGYGVILTSSLVFSLTKWFDDFPKTFTLCLVMGFIFFFISDYILGYRILNGISLFPGIEAVGITYLLGQMLIHLSPMFANES